MDAIYAEMDKEDWQAGQLDTAYRFLGAHLMDAGTHFAVWAPAAYSVSVVGPFNDWDGRDHRMKKHEGTGIWTVFVPKVDERTLYKYELKTAKDATPFLKTDPYARAMELRPKTASLVYDLDRYSWSDEQWMAERDKRQSFRNPISIYEVHLPSWKRKEDNEYLTYRELANELIPYVKEMAFTHIELMPITEYPHDPSWGYQVMGYFTPTSRLGTPKDFMYFIDQCHKHGIGVIMDWVPGHFPKDEHGLQMFDGTPLYEYADPKKREQKEWGTNIFDYGKPGVQNFLLSNARFWCEKFHIDGFRVDAVASMLYLDYSKNAGEWSPNKHGGNEHLEAIQFLKDFNTIIHREFPGILTFAEESTSWPGMTTPVHHGGIGFDYKWNMGWMNDTLAYFKKGARERAEAPNKITFPMMYNYSENFVLPLSHDEVVHLKKPLVRKGTGSESQQFANLRLLFTYMYGHPGKKLLFMGGEFAETSEWSEDRELHWSLMDQERHQGIQQLVKQLNVLYRYEPAMHQFDRSADGFEWIELGEKTPSVFAFLRKAEDPSDHLLFVFNFSDRKIADYSLGPFLGVQYRTIFNSDSHFYGGENGGGHYGNMEEQYIWLSSFSALILKPERKMSGNENYL
ncbi:1,4-alpha-glucan branching protein GlgB [Fodinibius halophilus]|uniref:1,4-alpha-glucan branching enzyme GlgB n=1 Tax=Fodinibius halophilus TaxID=1736908 RepID=A0A6M1TFW3_9BACT|nr:1,4-alpha-glucan branching protein GlgB [Fodinibius halophilus]NGP87530.1 1,4-alpha-glucan branching protein GlgB [Fodinibius halophilus]